jgi:hypothetical protein
MNGDTVLVQPGAYVENINFNGHNIILGSLFLMTEDYFYVESTVIDGNSTGSVVRFENGEDSTAVITGFTITNGSGSRGAGIYCDSANPVICNNLITKNISSFSGGGIQCQYCSPLIENNVIAQNFADYYGGGIQLFYSGSTLINNTVAQNDGTYESGVHVGGDSMSTMINTIVWNNTSEYNYPQVGGNISVSYCNIDGGWPGSGNIDSIPLFLNPNASNYNVCSQSVCIDAGDPSVIDPDSTRSDIGVYFPFHPDCFNGDVWHVSVDGNDTTGNGSFDNPYRTVQKGINTAFPGDTVLVHNGFYVENIAIRHCYLDVISEYYYTGNFEDIQATILDGSAIDAVVNLIYCDSTVSMGGFTIQNGFTTNTGGIDCYFSEAVLKSNIIRDNSVGTTACGIYCEYSNPLLLNSIITGNFNSGHAGYGIRCFHSDVRISNCTITNNGGAGGGGVYVYGGDFSTIINNSIIWGNSPQQIYDTGPPNATVEYSDIQGGWEGIGNIAENPLFVDPDSNDFNVCWQSPCIDAGDPNILDPDGTRSDMGFFFYDHPQCDIGNLWYVSTTGNDSTGNGSYEYPLRTIQYALNQTFYLDTVIILEGTYYENITVPDNDVVIASEFILSGDSSAIDSTIIDGDSAGSVITIDNIESSSPEIVGLTITNGMSSTGAGIYCLNSTPVIRNNKIIGNVAIGENEKGGGIYCNNSEAAIISNRIISNYSGFYGGGIYIYECSPTLENCIIANNTSESSGGGICVYYSNALVRNNLFYGNYGYAISCDNQFSGPTIINNTICDNANSGISVPTYSNAIIKNNILWYNGPTQIFGDGGDITYCCVEGGWPGTGNIPDNPIFVDRIGGNYNVYDNSPCIDAGDPMIIDPDSTRSDIGQFFYTHPSYQDRDIWFVSPTGNDQTGNGSQSNPFRTIQHAVDLANDGDTVIASQGTYEENIIVFSKNLFIASNFLFSNDTLDISGTTMDGNNSGSVIIFMDCPDSSKIMGFSVINGDGVNGGGITCLNSDIVIWYNYIYYNDADSCGGGIYCLNSNVIITDNRIENNYGYQEGGGVYLGNSGGLFLSNTVRLNRTGNGEGGGITCNNSNLEIRDNLISENRRYGVNCEASSNGTIISNTIMNNGTNDTPEWGGIYCYGSSPDIVNNIIWGNRGPGIRAPGSNSLILNNTICQNNRYFGAGGIDIGGSDLTVKNCIIWNNVSPQISGAGQADISYCDVDGGWPGIGNIDAYPMFVNPSLQDFNICTQSPCIDTGDPSILDPDSTRSDIGVYFPFHPDCDYGNRWYVSITGNDTTGNGSYENPFRTIQNAINIANLTDTIVVENGTYMENVEINGKNLSLASNYLFSNDTLDIQNTIIDGDSASTAVLFGFCDSATTIMGFTIRFGRGRQYYGEHLGGGIYSFQSDVDIISNIIQDNYSNGGNGGGVSGKNSTLLITDNIIKNNSAVSGGGIFCENADVQISDNKINENVNEQRGGGIYVDSCLTIRILKNEIMDNDGSAVFCYNSYSIISGNKMIGNSGGGLRMDEGYDSYVSNNIIAGNYSNLFGGGLYVMQSYPLLINNVIYNNSTSGDGGGIYSRDSQIMIENSILWADSAEGSSDEIYYYGTVPSLIYCDIFGGWAGIGNIDTDPLFRDAEGGDYHLMAIECGDSLDSPCIDTGNPEVLDSLLDCLWGLSTNISDMGAYGGGDSIASSIDVRNLMPQFFELKQNYPNPFNHSTQISYALPQAAHVILEVFDVLGRRVSVLVDEVQQSGYHQITWKAAGKSSGIYLYRIQAGNFKKTRKLILLK